ncbi:MAG: electron transfer flavoprotein subunit beta/FixA family protein [Ktedonobacteraceae bacterium]|nr:electron transfer flavoprotein subunit beta/FixA family protein [Ktedonobacteraceae bacterium]
MDTIVCIKQTPDSGSVYIDPISGQVDVERFVQILNPADACAVEAAVRFKEQLGGTVLALTAGPKDAEGALRAALAIGADSAVRIWSPQAAAWGPFRVATALAAYMQKGTSQPDLILCGDSASDWSSGVVGPALAEKLGLPLITGVTQLTLAQEQDIVTIQATRRLERGYRELLAADCPLLITVTADLNEPRYPALPAHLAALRTSIPQLDPQSMMDTGEQEDFDETTILEIHTPRPRPRRLAAPDSHHSAFERIGEIIAGGTTGHQGRLAEGSSEELARSLVEFLRERGFV